MNEQVKLPVVELVYRRKPSKKYKIESARDAYELLVSPFKDTIEPVSYTHLDVYKRQVVTIELYTPSSNSSSSSSVPSFTTLKHSSL